MPDAKYLILGGGMTADAAVRGIREIDPKGPITILSADTKPPYNRPPLSKGLWKGQKVEQIWRRTEEAGVELLLGRRAVGLDAPNRRVTDDRGAQYAFEKLLIATGGTPRELPFGQGEIIYFRTFDDYERLRSLSAGAQRVAVIGSGFIGSEIAAALAMNGKPVVMMTPEEGIARRIFPADLSRWLAAYYGEKGVEVLAGESVTGLAKRDGRYVLTLRNAGTTVERSIDADVVVAGIGIQPNVDLARSAGLEVENGVVVDASLHTRHRDILAAGDVAAFYNPALGTRIRVEHEDNANTMGRSAGLAMAGHAVVYDHLPFFYSDLFDLGYEAVGELDSRLETFTDWKEPYREGVIYYLSQGRVRGVLLWNVWDQVENARRLIAEPGPFAPQALKGRLPA